MKNIAIAALLSAFVAAPAIAENFYTTLDIGQSKSEDSCAGTPSYWTGCQNTATMYRIAGGLQFAPMWGVEVSYADYGKASLGSGFYIPLGMTISGAYKASGIQVSGTGTFPLGNAFALIGKLGIASTNLTLSGSGGGVSASQSATSTKLAFGIGAQYDFTKNISARAQYEDLGDVGDSNTTGTSKLTLLSAGVVYRF